LVAAVLATVLGRLDAVAFLLGSLAAFFFFLADAELPPVGFRLGDFRPADFLALVDDAFLARLPCSALDEAILLAG
jgi:hypothetical protein